MEEKNKNQSSPPNPEPGEMDSGKRLAGHLIGRDNWFIRFKTWLRKDSGITQTRKAIVLDDLVDSASPKVGFFILIILSCAIATFGLIVDSPAAIIGAMLVAPLMSPILGLSIASISGLARLFRRSSTAVLAGVGISILLSALLTFVALYLPSRPLIVISNEIIARTKPSLIDLGIALAGGIAAAYALAHPRLSAALPGVAIATALMPPICTIGIGIALLDPSIFLGASLLFATNLAAISFAGILTFALMGFGPSLTTSKSAVSRSLRLSTMSILVIMILLAVFTWSSFSEDRKYNTVRAAILETTSELTQVYLVDLSIVSDMGITKISAVLRTSRQLTSQEVNSIQSVISDSIHSPVSLELVTVPMQVFEVPAP